MNDLHETDDLRVLDDNGDRALKLFCFGELGPPIADECGHVRRNSALGEVRAAEDVQ